jgi:hypothetical protein
MKYFILMCIFTSCQVVFCQIIFDFESSFNYVQYLNSHKDYGNLLQVLNMLETSYPNTITVKLWKAKCLINLKKPAKALGYLATFNPDSVSQNECSFLQLKSLLLSDNFNNIRLNYFNKINGVTNELLCYFYY